MHTFEKKDKKGVLKIKISKEEWEIATEHSYEKNKGKYNIQGFRKGKAPRKVIEQNYGDTVFFDDAFDEVIYNEYTRFLAENTEIVPAGQPQVTMDKFTIEDGIEATLTFDMMPEFKLPKLEELGVKRPKIKVDDKQIEQELENTKASHARFVEQDKKAENGDYATIDFVGYVDGKEFEGGSANDYRLQLGSHTFIEGFEEGVEGMSKGEEKDINVTFPENYGSEELQGKHAIFKVTLKKVESKVLPDIDDKFVADTTEFETLEEYKASIKENLMKVNTEKAERDYELALLDTLAEKCNIELTDAMVNFEVDRIIEDFAHRLSHQGMNFDDYLSYLGKSADEFRAERREDAAKNIRTRLALQKVISEFKIAVSPAEIDEAVAEYANKYQMNVEDFKKAMSPNDYSFFENNAIMTKVLNFIKSKNENK